MHKKNVQLPASGLTDVSEEQLLAAMAPPQRVQESGAGHCVTSWKERKKISMVENHVQERAPPELERVYEEAQSPE